MSYRLVYTRRAVKDIDGLATGVKNRIGLTLHIASNRQLITDLISRGRYCFATEEAVQVLGTGMIPAPAALRRLQQKGELTSPYKGFTSLSLRGTGLPVALPPIISSPL